MESFSHHGTARRKTQQTDVGSRTGTGRRAPLILRGPVGYSSPMPERRSKQLLGRRGEDAAERFLRVRARYRVIARNYRCPFGEIDLVALDGCTVVFVEVRSQTGSRFGDPLASVTSRKQRQIAKAALYYLSRSHWGDCEARFDVVGIRWEQGQMHLTHIKDAFPLPQG